MGQCFRLHGRAYATNGAPDLRIWRIGADFLIFWGRGGSVGSLPRAACIIPPYGICSSKDAEKQGKGMKDKLPEISKEKQKLVSRIRRLAGQIDAVQRSVTDGDECADILMLLAAIRGGVNSLMAEILEDHIRLHITHPNRATDSPEELTEDLIGLVRAYLK